ncbi:MAG TPA: SDR family oxidoreductase, partial [Clostridia bacterium]|nr:SDR family oxidoreductase [Clostridia bacterium]
MQDRRVAIITGAAKGIGRAIALELATREIIPVITDIDEPGARKACHEAAAFGVDASYFKADVSSVRDIYSLVENVCKKYGRIDILVNNAGILSTASVEDLTEDEWDRVQNVNVKSAVFLTQAVLPFMKKNKWGRIIN